MPVIIAIALKDLRQLWRDRFGMFWVIAFPLLMALFFGSIFSGGEGGARSLKIAWVSESASPSAKALREVLGKSSALAIQDLPLDSARHLVASGKLVAYVQYLDSAGTQGGFFGMPEGNLKVGIDPSCKAEAGYLEGLLNQAYFSQVQEMFTDRDRTRKWIQQGISHIDSAPGMAGEKKSLYRESLVLFDSVLQDLASSETAAGSGSGSPFGQLNLEFEDIAVNRRGPRSSWEITFPQSLQWALIGVVAAFAIGLVMERTRGTYMRLRLAPISRTQILAGKGLACFMAGVTVCLALMLFGVLVFQVRVASYSVLLVSIVAAGICFVGVMMFISVLGKTENSVAGAGWAILLVMSMAGGGMMPLMFMPAWLGTLSSFSPVKWSILALEGAIWRGFGWSDMLLPLGMLVTIGVVGFSVGVTILRRLER
ncbi:MAG: ABC transporter permease [Candidatus Zixiibacteriota bacterium]